MVDVPSDVQKRLLSHQRQGVKYLKGILKALKDQGNRTIAHPKLATTVAGMTPPQDLLEAMTGHWAHGLLSVQSRTIDLIHATLLGDARLGSGIHESAAKVHADRFRTLLDLFEVPVRFGSVDVTFQSGSEVSHTSKFDLAPFFTAILADLERMGVRVNPEGESAECRCSVTVVDWSSGQAMGSGPTVFSEEVAVLQIRAVHSEDGNDGVSSTLKFQHRVDGKAMEFSPPQTREVDVGKDLVNQIRPHLFRVLTGYVPVRRASIVTEVICPCCGHRGVVVTKTVSKDIRVERCLSCSRDSITGAEVNDARTHRKAMTEAESNQNGGTVAIVFGLIGAVGGYFDWFPFWILVVGSVMVGIGTFVCVGATLAMRRMDRESRKNTEELKFGESRAENERRIQSIADANFVMR